MNMLAPTDGRGNPLPNRDGETPDIESGPFCGYYLEDWREMDNDEITDCAFALLDAGLRADDLIEALCERLNHCEAALHAERRKHGDAVKWACEVIDYLREKLEGSAE